MATAPPPPPPPAIGIDLGTTNSCVGVWQFGMVEIVADDENDGARTTPSCVAFTDHELLVGAPAKRRLNAFIDTTDPDAVTAAEHIARNTVFDVKRLIGRRFDDESVQADRTHLPFEVVDRNHLPVIAVNYRKEKVHFSPEAISARVLRRMRDIASAYVGVAVVDAVITVPAYFTETQRAATKAAGAIAGLNVLRIINEPTAAAIAFGLDNPAVGERHVLVFDLGGGTLDVSVLTIDEGVVEVRATAGNTHLGGGDFDNALLDFLVDEFNAEHGVDMRESRTAVQRLRANCEQAKCALSTATVTTVAVERLFQGIHYRRTLTRAAFEQLCVEWFERTIDPVEQALADAALHKSQIDEVVLVGGSTRIPRVRALLTDYFDGKPLNTSVNADEAVAYGAALHAAALTGADTKLSQELLLLDVTPLSLGVQTVGGAMTTLIGRNTQLPTSATKVFSTTEDDQRSVLVQVYEGERALTRDNNLLGRFQLSGIPPATARVPHIEVTFEVDVDGILHVTAVERSAGQKAVIAVRNRERLTEQQIQQHVNDAERHRLADEQHRQRVEAVKGLRAYGRQLRATVTRGQFAEVISELDCRKVNDKVDEVVDRIDGETTVDDIGRLRRELEAVCKPVMNKYKAAVKGTEPSHTTNIGFRSRPEPSAASGGNNPRFDSESVPKKNKPRRTGPLIEELD